MLRILLIVLQVLVGLSVLLSFVALLATVLMLLKVAVQEFIKEFGLKKTVAVAMALVLLPIATAHAGNTVAKIEDGNLVYYQKTGVAVRDVPKGLTAEQAQQLVDGAIPSVKLSAEKTRSYFGLPFTKIKTDTTVLFRNGWATEGESHESLSAAFLFVVSTFIIYGFIAAYSDDLVMVFAVAGGLLFVSVAAVFSVDHGSLETVGASAVLLSVGYSLGLYLRRRREKRHAAHVLAVET